MPSYLETLDNQKAILAEQWPGWQIWYVTHHQPMHVTWCAQPRPLLNCHSPEELNEEIAASGVTGLPGASEQVAHQA